ncbi:MAG: 30S ribosomal protein S16 [Candidatus Cloacimonetes bacterium]|nr:30S ribosomal protein S16 [Candidatus Cloacimonadota bacterium]
MVKLRLKRMGAIDKPFYRIVALDSRKKRDGVYLESLGYYDPKTDPSTLKVDIEKALNWLKVGAQPSDTVRSLFKKAGVLEKWHNTKFQTTAGDKKAKNETKPAEKKTVKKEAKPTEKKAGKKEEKSAEKKPVKKETKTAEKKITEKATDPAEKKKVEVEKDSK